MITHPQHPVARRPLIALLRDIPIAAFLAKPQAEGGLSLQLCVHRHDKIDVELVTDCTLPRWSRRSREEVMEAVLHMKEQMGRMELPKSIFSLLPQVAAEYLTVRESQVRVKQKHYLRWRDLSLHLDGDLFIIAALAQQDLRRQWPTQRWQFEWADVLLPEDLRFEALYQRGVADNHTHLDAMGPVFMPAWISLMNKVKGRYGDFEKPGIINKHLAGEIHPRPNWQRFSLYHQVLDAAALRFSLWQAVRAHDEDSGKEFERYEDGFLTNTPLIHAEINKLQSAIGNEYLQARIGRGGRTIENELLDYAAFALPNPRPDIAQRLDTGERYLLYRLLRGIYDQQDWVKPLADQLYRYLVIKHRFRKELIQVNERIGFGNFFDYQERKDVFASREAIKHHRFHPVLVENQRRFGIHYQDLRFRPKASYAALADKLQTIGKTLKAQAAGDANAPRASIVAHFIKLKEVVRSDSASSRRFPWIAPRHAELRREVKRQSLAILHLRQVRHQFAGMIQSIDAANSELNCRPEVFAQAYRALRAHELPPGSPSRALMRGSLEATTTQQTVLQEMYHTPPPASVPMQADLRVKHHAGEEYLDLLDGLRYLDEAIYFLNLQRGDYLGHALAAGMDVREWYARKSNKIYLSKQAALDNYVWLANVTTRYGIAVNSTQRSAWERQIQQLFGEIYHGELSDEEIDRVDAKLLYEAWKLRGDDPALYRELDLPPTDHRSIWRRHALNEGELCRDANRKSRSVRQLYHLYHYSKVVRREGQQQCSVRYIADEIGVIGQVQLAIRNQIAGLGLFVETLPTINVLIGEFRYESHPIFRFFPVRTAELPEGHLPLHVSVNPDNPGVIVSNATAELAMLMVALQKTRDPHGKPIYNDEEIYAWLERIRQMGEEQRILPGISIRAT